MSEVKTIVKEWIHVKMTLGLDPSKYIHLLLPDETDPSILELRLSNRVSDIMLSDWLANYPSLSHPNPVGIRGVDFIYNENYRSIADLVKLLSDKQARYINKDMVVLADNAALFDWMTSSSEAGRDVRWYPANYNDPLHKRYLRLTETVNYYGD